MRIAILSKSDASGGGAGRMAARLAAQLNAAGHECHHWTRFWREADVPWRFHLYGSHATETLARCRDAVDRWGWLDMLPVEQIPLRRKGRAASYDVIHVHDTPTAISPSTIRWLGGLRPVLWTFHDCSPFTGGCLFPDPCDKYRSGCSACPQLGRWPQLTTHDRSDSVWRQRTALARSGRYVPSAPSDWMADTAMATGLFATRPAVVPYGIDLDVFSPRPQREARARLGLPLERRIVLLSAASLDEPRKGMRDALAVVRALPEPRPLVAFAGRGDVAALAGPLEHAALGFLSDPATMADAYSAADAFVSCTTGDNLPLVLIEALACGTPCFAYATGGVAEIVRDGCEGGLARTGDRTTLTARLAAHLAAAGTGPLREACRARALTRFDERDYLRLHLELYASLIARWKGTLPS